jgi:hypothetical protein
MLKTRLSKKAQKEIRDMFVLCLYFLSTEAPVIFEDILWDKNYDFNYNVLLTDKGVEWA